MAQPGIAQASEQASVTPIADLLIEQQGEPFGMGERGGLSGCFDLSEGLGHAVESELMGFSPKFDGFFQTGGFQSIRWLVAPPCVGGRRSRIDLGFGRIRLVLAVVSPDLNFGKLWFRLR